jgi:hypothetical protein
VATKDYSVEIVVMDQHYNGDLLVTTRPPKADVLQPAPKVGQTARQYAAGFVRR